MWLCPSAWSRQSPPDADPVLSGRGLLAAWGVESAPPPQVTLDKIHLDRLQST